jgi:hypothetical protein
LTRLDDDPDTRGEGDIEARRWELKRGEVGFVNTRVESSGRTLEDARHKVLLTLLRVQLAASGIGVLFAIPLAPGPEAIPIFIGCAAALSVLAVVSFAPMSYSTRASAYSLIFAALAVILAVIAGPIGPTFLVMCGALILPLILLPPRAAWGFVLGTFALVSLVGWAHVAGVIDWLRRERPDIPVLVMSGYTEDEQVRRGVSTGELPFLRKPFSAADLVLATREVLQNTDPATTS